MFKSIHPAVEAALIFLLLAVLMCIDDAWAQDVKYCKDAQTGDVIVVEAGMPCPFPYHEL